MNITANQYRERYAKKSEEQIQCECVAWFRKNYPRQEMLLFSSLNGVQTSGKTKKQRAIQGARLNAAGRVRGVADLFLSIPSGELCGLYIEMKTPTGTQSKEQKEFERQVIERGYGYVMPRSLEEFKRLVKTYLEAGEPMK